MFSSGKTTFFVANQNSIDAMPDDKVSALEGEIKALEEDNKVLVTGVRSSTAGILKTVSFYLNVTLQSCTELAKLRSTPTDAELSSQITEAEKTVRLFTAGQ